MSTEPADGEVAEGPEVESSGSETEGSGMPLWRRAIHIAVLLVFLAVVAVFVVYAVPQVIGADHSYVVLTASMSPEIEPGDAVVVGEVEPAEIAEGDVITFYRSADEPPVTHRVVGITETSDGYLYETKGDANEEPDANPVPHENVVGSVVVTIPYLGHVIQFANTTEGFLALVVLPFGLLLLSEAYSVVGSSRERGDPETETREADGSGSGDASTEGTDALVLTPAALRTAIGVLAVVAPASAYLAVRYPTAISVTVAIGASISLLVAVGIRLLGNGSGGESDDTADPDEPDDPALERNEIGEPVGDGAGNTIGETDAGAGSGEEPR
ncbi:signal peptidase I [Saliphagus infecundisoli]|uniref:Signal peptidase I n=1 Tax=Saliphagus infecundisoli TaxID=1849069 RepID=A0ABD5QE33_9EURY|nr:signal peptidase I [Saliphagus infecundisoli]